MKANYTKPLNKSDLDKLIADKVDLYKEQYFKEWSNDIMTQTLSAILICLERNYDFKQKRLKNFISQLHLWLDVMEENSDWTNQSNIDYLKEKYGIDLKSEFSSEVKL